METNFFTVTWQSARSNNDHFIVDATDEADAIGQVACYLNKRGIGLPNPAQLVKKAVRATLKHRTNYEWLPAEQV